MNIDIEFDGEQVDIIAHLRTVIILAARSSTSSEIEIDAVDQIVETTIDFMKNLLEHMARNSNNDSLAPNDLLNTLRLNPHLIPNRTLYFSIMETINHL